MTIEEIKNLPTEEAIEALNTYISRHPHSDEAFTLRGLRHWAMSHRSEAIKDYLEAIRINPESKAVQALESAQAILNFYNKDLYNP